MKYSLVCECGYQTALTEDEDELYFDLKQDLLNHQEWCEIAIKNGGKHDESSHWKGGTLSNPSDKEEE
tara:strand:+ start:82 stop:285 length:204 start_codon:yes stop_codon:yes gene_type:complete